MFDKKIYLTIIIGLGFLLGGSLTAYMIVMLTVRFPMFKIYLALITGLGFLLAGSLSLYKNKQKKIKNGWLQGILLISAGFLQLISAISWHMWHMN
ncbi:MAG: hypothetical protein PHQ17_08210 [Methanobacterium sp.]|nr:hypothetical protein [Methanobacterium sp.]